MIERLDALDEEYSASGRSAINGKVAAYWVGEVGQLTSEDRDKRLKNMATIHMAKGLAQNLVYYSRLLKAHPQTLVAGHATCCEMHAGLDAPA